MGVGVPEAEMFFHIMKRRWCTPAFLAGCCLILTVLWLPGLKYPVVSDTLNYALLGRSVWEEGRYALNGVPYAVHLPMQAIVSYPLVRLLGIHLGMHVSSLLAGFGVLVSGFLLARRLKSPVTLITIAILIHPAFILMSILGSADLLFTALFLFSLLAFLEAEDDEWWYVAAGILAGLASLTRYNGLPLFALFLGWVLWKRRRDLRNGWFWCGLGLGLGLVSLWFLRNTIVFGNPFYSSYVTELAHEAPNIPRQFLENILYYANPVHNLFPFFFVLALIGLWGHARKFPFLVLATIAAGVISMIWWVQAIRFLFPAFVLLLIFAVVGLRDVIAWSRRSPILLSAIALIGLAVQVLSICLYTYGECNALFDRTLGLLVPKNMGLTTEGFYAWHLARNELDRRAETGAFVRYDSPQGFEGIFRRDLRLGGDGSCPLYAITQHPQGKREVIFQTEAHPMTSVVREEC